MNEKWNVQQNKKDIKIHHLAVNVKTKEILALEITNEKKGRHDNKMMRKSVNHVLDSSNKKRVKIKSVLADGAYDSNTYFRYLKQKKIKPGIKPIRNSIISTRNNRLRNSEVMLQTKDLQKWKKKKRKY